MLKNTSLLLIFVMLGACAYAVDKGYQPLTIRTPGAQDAVCDVMANKVRYRFYPPATRNVKNSKEDLIVHCLAPGNRERKVVIRPDIADAFAGNVVTGFIPGASWDYASGAMFRYPDTVDVDFTTMKPKPMPGPVHNNPDNIQPEEYRLEEFRPNTSYLHEDQYRKPLPLQRRVAPGSAGDRYSDGAQGDNSAEGSFSSQAPVPDKGDLMSVIDNLGRDMAPTSQSDAVLEDNDGGLPYPQPSVIDNTARDIATPSEPMPLLPEEE